MKVRAHLTNDEQQVYLNASTIIPPQTEAFPYWTIKYILKNNRDTPKCDFLHTGVTKRIVITGGEEEENGTVRDN